MVETVTRPARKRAPAKSTAKPPQAVAEAPAAVEAAPVTTEAAASSERLVVVLEHVGTTRTYEKFHFPAGSGCAGNVYGPLGKTTAKVAFTD